MTLGFRCQVSGFRLLVWLVAVLWVGAPSAEAALAVSPSRVVLQLKPSKSGAGFFSLENRGSDPIEVTVEPEDWSGGIRGSRGPVSWLTVRPKHLSLQPGKHAKVKYTVRVPKDASGELRTQVFFTMASVSGSTALRSRLGTIIYVGIEGTEHIDAAITSVDASYSASTPGVTTPDRLDLLIRIHNRGNAHIAPEGSVVIRDATDRTVATVPLQSGWGLLPNEEDGYRAIGTGVYLAPGRYRMDLSIMCGGDLRHPTTLTKTMALSVTDNGQVHLEDDVVPPPASR